MLCAHETDTHVRGNDMPPDSVPLARRRQEVCSNLYGLQAWERDRPSAPAETPLHHGGNARSIYQAWTLRQCPDHQECNYDIVNHVVQRGVACIHQAFTPRQSLQCKANKHRVHMSSFRNLGSELGLASPRPNHSQHVKRPDHSVFKVSALACN